MVNNTGGLMTKGCFPVMRFFYVRIRTKYSEHVNSFIDAY